MAETTNAPELHPVTEELASGKNFAAVPTMLPSGQFQTGVMWVGVRDGAVVLNTETHRRRYQNKETSDRAQPASSARPGAGLLRGDQLAQGRDDHPVVLDLGQSGDDDDTHRPDVPHDQRKAAAVRGEQLRVEPELLLEGGAGLARALAHVERAEPEPVHHPRLALDQGVVVRGRPGQYRVNFLLCVF